MYIFSFSAGTYYWPNAIYFFLSNISESLLLRFDNCIAVICQIQWRHFHYGHLTKKNQASCCVLIDWFCFVRSFQRIHTTIFTLSWLSFCIMNFNEETLKQFTIHALKFKLNRMVGTLHIANCTDAVWASSQFRNMWTSHCKLVQAIYHK